jgi:hypothetical protein
MHHGKWKHVKEGRSRERFLVILFIIIILASILGQVCGNAITCVARTTLCISESNVGGNLLFALIIIFLIFAFIYFAEYEDFM